MSSHDPDRPATPRLLSSSVLLALTLTACGGERCGGGEAVDTSRRAAVDRHNVLIAEHKARSWKRPQAPGVHDGSAAAAYQHASEGCPHEELEAASGTLTNVIGDLRAADPRQPGATPPEGCELEGEALPSGFERLDAAGCELLKRCAEPLVELREGTLRQDATSPLAVWSPWTFEAPGHMRSRQVFIDLAKLLWLDGALAAARTGTLDPYLDALLAGMRLGADLRNGADLGPVVAGDLVRQLAADQLRALLAHVGLDVIQLSAVKEGLLHVLAHPDPWPSAIDANILHLSSGLLVDLPQAERLPSEDLATPEAHFMFNPHTAPREATVALEHFWPAWDTLRAELATEASFAARLPSYTRYQAAIADIEGLAKIEEVHVYKYDLYRTATETSLCMVLIEVASRLLQAEGGPADVTLAGLDSEVRQRCERDPLTGAPFVLARDGATLVLRSPLRDDPLFSELPEGARRFVPDLYGRLETRWSAPLPEPATPDGDADSGDSVAPDAGPTPPAP